MSPQRLSLVRYCLRITRQPHAATRSHRKHMICQTNRADLAWVRFPSPASTGLAPIVAGASIYRDTEVGGPFVKPCPGCLQLRYNHGYTQHMKTAISIPDAIFEEAERLAKIRGWSRSELYANAVSAYVNSERFLGVREKLDAVYGRNVDDSAVDPVLAKAQARSLPKEKW